MASVFLTAGLLFESSCSNLNVMKHVEFHEVFFLFVHNEAPSVPGQNNNDNNHNNKKKERERESE